MTSEIGQFSVLHRFLTLFVVATVTIQELIGDEKYLPQLVGGETKFLAQICLLEKLISYETCPSPCRWPMAESIYLLPEYDRWHAPYSASSRVSQRQNPCFTSLWRLTGNDPRYSQIDITILCDLRLTSLIRSKSTKLASSADRPVWGSTNRVLSASE